MKHNYQVIEGKYLVQNCVVTPGTTDVFIEKCPFCGTRHMHGAGGSDWDWGQYVTIVEGIRTLGHRADHCLQKGVEITLHDGTVVCNDRGYFLGIGDQQPGC